MISLDFESSGLDLFHGAQPFCVVWRDTDKTHAREWPVDPLTRRCEVPVDTVREVRDLVGRSDKIVFHNANFDMRCLEHLGITPPWDRFEDTMVAAHVLFSAPPHNLTYCCNNYLDLDISRHERALEKAVKKCRSMVQQARLREKRYGPDSDDLSPIRHWKIASENDPDLPSNDGEESWRSDYWLPAAMFRHDPTNPDLAGFGTVLREYALVDAAVTYRLWERLEQLLKERGLWKVYRAKLEVVPAAYRMERRGMGVKRDVMRDAQHRYREESEELGTLLVGIAGSMGYDLTLPKGSTNHCLDDFVFGRAVRGTDGKRDAKKPRTHAPDTLNLPVVAVTESGAPSFGSDARDCVLADLSKNSKSHLFVTSFSRKSELDKGLSYLDAYERFLLPSPAGGEVIHPSFRVIGTQGTRLSSSNPNAQNISLQSAVNLRHCFGSALGREWYSMDAANIELRIPAYLAGESELIRVFDRPDDPPYYGSYHLVVFDTLWPDIFAKYGKDVKSHPQYESSHYKPVKNGNFARQYGAQEAKVDATYGVKGGFRKVANRFPKIDALNRATIATANKYGKVWTVPDKDVDPERGYPIVCRRNVRDVIPPTVPFAYFVSGTAGWWMNRAIAKCDRIVERWRKDGYDGHMIATVHDEILFDLPVCQTVHRVISGGQTGADQAGLRAGRAAHRETGGWVNTGYKTLAGPNPSLRDFGLVETGTDDYPTRTEWNVRDSDATIRFASDFNTPGELCTMRAINKYGKPYLNVSLLNQRPHTEVVAWLKEHNVRTLNVAGNSESRCTGIGKYTEQFLSKVLALDNDNLPRVHELRAAMESCGNSISVPTPVKIEKHRISWAVGEEVK